MIYIIISIIIIIPFLVITIKILINIIFCLIIFYYVFLPLFHLTHHCMKVQKAWNFIVNQPQSWRKNLPCLIPAMLCCLQVSKLSFTYVNSQNYFCCLQVQFRQSSFKTMFTSGCMYQLLFLSQHKTIFVEKFKGERLMRIKPLYPRQMMHGECFPLRLFVWSSGCTNQLFHLRQQSIFFANMLQANIQLK